MWIALFSKFINGETEIFFYDSFKNVCLSSCILYNFWCFRKLISHKLSLGIFCIMTLFNTVRHNTAIFCCIQTDLVSWSTAATCIKIWSNCMPGIITVSDMHRIIWRLIWNPGKCIQVSRRKSDIKCTAY